MMPLKVGEEVICAIDLAHGNVPTGTVGTVISLFAYGRKCRVRFPVRPEMRCELYQSQFVEFDNPSDLLSRKLKSS